MRRRDVFREALVGLRYRKVRSVLCALGIAIGAAAVVAVVGIPASTQATLLAELGRDGNLLTVASGQTMNRTPVPLPEPALGMVARVDGVQRAASVGQLPGRGRAQDVGHPGGGHQRRRADGRRPGAVATLDLSVTRGRFLDPAIGRHPVVVLVPPRPARSGSRASERRCTWVAATGCTRWWSASSPRCRSRPSWTRPRSSAPDWRTTRSGSGTSRAGSTCVPTRTASRRCGAGRRATAHPRDPGTVTVGRPSDLLATRVTTRGALLGLAIGLGAVALLVGGVGVANVMVVSVLERRGEIGIRRALGATRLTVGLVSSSRPPHCACSAH